MANSNSSRRKLLVTAAALPLAALTGGAHAQSDRPIRFIMPFAAGSGTDTAFRPYIEAMARHLKQPIVIDNRGGANGLIGMEAAAKAAPDGYTFALGNVGIMVINRFIYSKLPYDPDRDFDLVGTALGTANALTVRKDLEANSVAELIALAKRQPGRLKVASGGIGTTGHLSAALFDTMAGTQMVHVPYKSAVDAFKDMVNGDIDVLIENVALSSTFIRGGRVRPLGVTSRTRVASLPDVPTLDEAGLKGFEILAWAGFVVPKGTPAAMIQRLNEATRAAVTNPEVRKATESFSLDAIPGSPQEFAALIQSEIPKWSALVKRTGAKLD
jgi:tripartite-type tricarboxylate transporter receptor subunit TctC